MGTSKEGHLPIDIIRSLYFSLSCKTPKTTDCGFD